MNSLNWIAILLLSALLARYYWPPMAFLLGPFFYLYVRALTDGSLRLRRKHLLHFVPALLCIVGLLPYYLQPVENKI